MTPNDLDQYLQVFEKHTTSSVAMKLPDGTELHVVFTPKFPAALGEEPTPGGWKSPQHLDDPAALREHKGELPS